MGKIKEHIQYTFLKDGYFAELKNAEILRERLSLAQEVSPYVGKYYSVEYVRKNILQQTDEDIIEIDGQIAGEIKTWNYCLARYGHDEYGFRYKYRR